VDERPRTKDKDQNLESGVDEVISSFLPAFLYPHSPRGRAPHSKTNALVLMILVGGAPSRRKAFYPVQACREAQN